jgi:hypothetical protein
MYNKCLKDPVGLPMIEDRIIDEMDKIDMTLTGVDAVRILACHVNALRDMIWLRTRIQVEIESLQEIIKEQDNGAIPTHIACIERILSDDKIRGLLPSHYIEQIEQVIKENKSKRPVWNTLYRSTWNPNDVRKTMI